jgi:hypothetical protein
MMDVRRKRASLLAAACFSVASLTWALTPASDAIDPLAPIGPLASLDMPPPGNVPAMMLPLRRQASAALSELRAAGERDTR